MTFMEDKSQLSAAARRCWVEGRRIYVELLDDRIISFPAEKYPLLASASAAQLGTVQLRLHGRALRWKILDEDISIEDVISGRFPRIRSKVA
jgi:hypothetical protein